MKDRSEQAPHGGREVGRTGESMTIAAQIFSDYKLFPPSRLPDSHTEPIGMHGASLPIFSDQPAKQVQLRKGYAAHVAGDAWLRAREDRVNQAASSHDSRSANSQQMTADSYQH